jgi:RNA polymerase sigma-70 factor (ECF subfamily)
MPDQGCTAERLSTQSDIDVRKAQLDRFLREVERRALKVAQLATRSLDDALELTQDAMLGFVRKYAEKPQSEWHPLFFTVLDSRILDFHRRSNVRGRWLGFLRRDPERPDTDPLANVIDADMLAPLEQLAGDQAGVALNRALRSLPDRQRQAFLLRIWEGFDVAQTAAVMRCSQGSVKTHLFRAMHALRARLEQHR